MVKQITLTFDDGENGDFSSEIDLKYSHEMDLIETFEVLFGALTFTAKDFLEAAKKYAYPREGDSPEAITAQAMNDVVKAYIKYIKRMHECDEL